MSSPQPADSEQTDSSKPSALHDILTNIKKMIGDLSVSPEEKPEAASHRQQATVGTYTAAAIAPQTAEKTDGDASQSHDKDESNKNDERKDFLHELEKLCKELQHMYSSFDRLEKFSTNLREALKTLEKNVSDILEDLHQVTDRDLRKQVPVNLHVLRHNITRVKIQIPLQHQTGNTNSEAIKLCQTTVASKEAEDLPQLYREGIFESSCYFKEIKGKYDALDTRHKLCLLCFALFPENAVIKKRLLRFWWIGENLLVTPEGGKDEMETLTETLKRFEEDGFIEPRKKRNKKLPRSYKMNPIVRSCVIKFADEAWFFDYDKEGNPTMDFTSCKKACMLKLRSDERATVPWFSKYLEDTEKYLQEHPGKERLSADLVKLQMLFSFTSRDKLEKASKQLDELQTLFNISRQFPALPKEWLSKMKAINVLYLGAWESEARRQRHIEVEDTEFLKGLKSMKALKLLSLQGISGIPKIPSSLCKLASLKILDLRACHSLEELPDMIGSLKKLTYLDVSECYLLDHMPKQTKKLSELEVLKGFVIGTVKKNSCTLEDLKSLEKLRKLSVNVHVKAKEFDIEKAGQDIHKFKNLKKLRIAWGSGSEEESRKGEGTKKQEEDKKEQTSVAEKPDEKKGAGSKGLRGAVNKVIAVNRFRVKINLEKLDLQCFPQKEPPRWLVPEALHKLEALSLRGGRLSYLDDGNWDSVKTLRLKFLVDFKMSREEMQNQFPNLEYLENVRCPRVTFCPCNADGVWQDSSIKKKKNGSP